MAGASDRPGAVAQGVHTVIAKDIHRMTRGWRRGPPVHTVPSPSGFPHPADENTVGMFCKEGVFVLDDPRTDVARVLAHEAVAHHGVRALLGPKGWSDLMLAVAAGTRDGHPKLYRVAQHVRRAYGDELRPRLAADEVIARVAELRADAHTGRLRVERPLAKRWAALRGRIMRDLLHCRRPATMDEVEGTLLEAEGLISAGRCSTVPWWRWYRPGMTKPMGPARPARDIEESERWLRESGDRANWWTNTKGFLCGLFLVLALPAWIVCTVWSLFGH